MCLTFGDVLQLPEAVFRQTHTLAAKYVYNIGVIYILLFCVYQMSSAGKAQGWIQVPVMSLSTCTPDSA